VSTSSARGLVRRSPAKLPWPLAILHEMHALRKHHSVSLDKPEQLCYTAHSRPGGLATCIWLWFTAGMQQRRFAKRFDHGPSLRASAMVPALVVGTAPQEHSSMEVPMDAHHLTHGQSPPPASRHAPRPSNRGNRKTNPSSPRPTHHASRIAKSAKRTHVTAQPADVSGYLEPRRAPRTRRRRQGRPMIPSCRGFALPSRPWRSSRFRWLNVTG